MINGPWQFPVLNEDTSCNYEVVPIPAPQAGETVVAPLGGETWTVPADRRHGPPGRRPPRSSQCLNSDENQLSRWPRSARPCPTKTALQEQFVAEQPTMKAFSELVETARARTGELGAGVAGRGHEDLHRRCRPR